VGVLIDSSVLIEAERKGLTARQALVAIESRFPNQDVVMSVISLAELAHGVARADTMARKQQRLKFMGDWRLAVVSLPVTDAVALKAGQIDGDSKARGVQIPFSDLLIGVTALEAGHTVVTSNVRHFQMIPGLAVTPF